MQQIRSFWLVFRSYNNICHGIKYRAKHGMGVTLSHIYYRRTLLSLIEQDFFLKHENIITFSPFLQSDMVQEGEFLLSLIYKEFYHL